jgi:hypothetical protein
MAEVALSNKLFYEAEAPYSIYKKIIGEKAEEFPGFDHLVFSKIKFFFKDTLSGTGWNKLGRIVRTNDLYWSLLDIDFIFIINKQLWDKMEIKQKITLILHLISKIKVYYKKSNGKKTLKKPDNSADANFDITSSGRINYKLVSPDVETFESVSQKFSGEYNTLKELAKAE